MENPKKYRHFVFTTANGLHFYFITNIQYYFINDTEIHELKYDYDSAMKLDYNNIDYFFIQIERNKGKKYLYNGNLYHVTTKNKMYKILKIGLCPKHKNKISTHPSRIYLCDNTNCSDKIIKKFKEIDKDKNIKNEYITIKLIVNKLEVCNDAMSNGLYTTLNIHPKFIDEISDENFKILYTKQ